MGWQYCLTYTTEDEMTHCDASWRNGILAPAHGRVLMAFTVVVADKAGNLKKVPVTFFSEKAAVEWAADTYGNQLVAMKRVF